MATDGPAPAAGNPLVGGDGAVVACTLMGLVLILVPGRGYAAQRVVRLPTRGGASSRISTVPFPSPSPSEVRGRLLVRRPSAGRYHSAPVWVPSDETYAFVGRAEITPNLAFDTIRTDGRSQRRMTHDGGVYTAPNWVLADRVVMSSSRRDGIWQREGIHLGAQGKRQLPNTAPVCLLPPRVAGSTL